MATINTKQKNTKKQKNYIFHMPYSCFNGVSCYYRSQSRFNIPLFKLEACPNKYNLCLDNWIRQKVSQNFKLQQHERPPKDYSATSPWWWQNQMFSMLVSTNLLMVAPRAGAWIEIRFTVPQFMGKSWSHPARVRGLKWRPHHYLPRHRASRTPRGCVGKTEQQNAAPPKKDGAASCYLDFS